MNVVAKIIGTTLINDKTGTRTVLFEHMVEKLAAVLLNVKDVETVVAADHALPMLEDLGRTILVLTHAYRSYSRETVVTEGRGT